MDAIPKCLKGHRVDIGIETQNSVAFARPSREQSSRVPPKAAHASDLLSPDHPHIGLTQRLEEPRGFEGDRRLRRKHGHDPDAPWREHIFFPLRFEIEDTNGP